jgi:16S rRNA (cytosine967-C5)-methyltransferase
MRAGSGPEPRGQVDPARLAALALLRAVDEQDAYANLVWPRILREHGLAGRDAGFATELAYGALRWRGRHDAILAACVDRGLASVQPVVRDALRLGVHQLQAMRVPPHAAVAQTVALVRARAHPGAAGFANAVLRRVAAGGDAEAWLARLVASGALPGLDDDPAAHLAAATSHPAWIVRAMHEALSASEPARTWADTRSALLADNVPGRVSLAARAVPRDDLLAELRADGIAAEPGRWARTAVRVSAVEPGSLPAVATGAAGVQDEGSQLVALLLADAPIEGHDLRWADLCAGPGGKAALLAAAVAERGGALTAVERHPHRADLVRSALRPVRGRHEVAVGDATTLDLPGGFDRILVDAPCTGLGALRRRPESRWRRSPDDLPALAPLQRGLLVRALELLRPGGLVCYATCSPHLAETEAVVALARRHGGRVLPVGELGLQLPAGSVAGPFLRLWPHRHDTDGMFAALVRREP